jgi:hypothetical protein
MVIPHVILVIPHVILSEAKDLILVNPRTDQDEILRPTASATLLSMNDIS